MLGLITTATIAGLIGLPSAASALTEDWRKLGRDGPVEVGVDVSSYQGPRTARTARTVMVPVEGPQETYMVLNVRIDCEARTISAIDIAIYDTAHELLRESAAPPATTSVSESDGTDLLARALCDAKDIPGPGMQSAAVFADQTATRPVEP